MNGKKLDLSSQAPVPEVPSSANSPLEEGRRFLGVQFDCCDVYSRVYISRDPTQYLGNCPKCARPVRFQVGPGGTASRFFRAS